MIKIGIIRHGSTSWNKEGRAQGSSDIPLDEDGLTAAYRLAERLSHENWNVIYSSPLLRAKQTAEAIEEKIGTGNIIYDARLCEVAGGKIEGTTEKERIQKWGKDWRTLDLGIEEVEHVIARGLSFIDEIIKKHHHESILIVSHGAFLKLLLTKILREANMETNLKNTSLTTIVYENNNWSCERYNCTSHLN
ncbi:histidine phosphatase family protein [Bacillus chungangensis]|uniref:Phosphoglycerate mutase n=1 Tax=Bacillus chungangensis TaxID=587633 RepID=A0ABT9WXN4_9BACI|nr:histidine phosphatase family protein [Bacillus chungangensis]MDQ0178057.1 putative phosphoglycerate mutase [Bacillus chungangensis]